MIAKGLYAWLLMIRFILKNTINNAMEVYKYEKGNLLDFNSCDS